MNEPGHLPKPDRKGPEGALRHRLTVWCDKAYEDDNLPRYPPVTRFWLR